LSSRSSFARCARPACRPSSTTSHDDGPSHECQLTGSAVVPTAVL
jgi:hypothetical protein